jgi:hypothetical protein
MAITVDTVLVLISVVLFAVSAFGVASPVDLFKLAFAFLAASLIF